MGFGLLRRSSCLTEVVYVIIIRIQIMIAHMQCESLFYSSQLLDILTIDSPTSPTAGPCLSRSCTQQCRLPISLPVDNYFHQSLGSTFSFLDIGLGNRMPFSSILANLLPANSKLPWVNGQLHHSS